MDDLTKILKDQSKKLSPTIKKVIESDSWVNTLKTIAWKYGLSKEAAESVDVETGLVLFGLESSSNFKKNLVAQNTGISSDTIEKIVSEIKTSVFGPIQNELDKFIQEQDASSQQKPSTLPGQNIESGIKFAPQPPKGLQEKGVVGMEELKKETVLEEIEHPQKFPAAFEKTALPAIPSSPNVADNKLNAVVKLPRQEVRQATSQASPRETPPQNPKYREPDPYREPIE